MVSGMDDYAQYEEDFWAELKVYGLTEPVFVSFYECECAGLGRLAEEYNEMLNNIWESGELNRIKDLYLKYEFMNQCLENCTAQDVRNKRANVEYEQMLKECEDVCI